MISAVVTCAGNSSRFGKDKLLSLSNGKEVIAHTLQTFCQNEIIGEVIAVIKKTSLTIYQELIRKYQLPVKLVFGGEKRYISAYNGVKAAKGSYVLIHDGARPLLSQNLINQVIAEVLFNDAIMTATPPQTCIKQTEANNFVKANLCRNETWLGQTPHAFKKEIVLKAYRNGIKNNLDGMDDCELVSAIGIKVKIVPGEENNFKITIPKDLLLANLILDQQKALCTE